MEKKRTKHDKTKLNSAESLISKAIIDSYVDHEKSVLVNNVLREYDKLIFH